MTVEAQRLVAVGRVDDIPPLQGRSVTVAGRRIAIFQTATGPRALDNACPHLGGPLADGLLGDDCVVCPLHGWRIDLATGRVEGQPDERVATIPVVERDGWLYLGVDWS